MLFSAFSLSATNYYVSTTGSDSNTGTYATPFLTVAKAVGKVTTAGDSVIIRSGTYASTSTLSITKSGSSSKHIVITAYKPDLTSASKRPVLDFSGMSVGSSNVGVDVYKVSYCDIYGLRIKGAGDNGMIVENSTNNCVFEFCDFYQNRDAGFLIRTSSHDCLILNCDAYANADMGTGTTTNGGNADGFAPKLDLGTNITFRGCRSWMNSDDGWDGYLKCTEAGLPTGMLTILENCWAFHNGYYWKDGTTTSGMNGNGIKMGGSTNKDQDHNFRVINCLSAYNKSKGFDQNNNAGSMYLYNCTAYSNGNDATLTSPAEDFALNASVTYVSGAVTSVINCVCPKGNGTSFKSGAILTTNNFTAATSNFSSTDTTGLSASRKVDGSLPDITFMHLASTATTLIDKGTAESAVSYYGATGIPYNGTAPDLGCFETTNAPSLTLTSGSNAQSLYTGTAITSIVYTYGGTATGVTLTGTLPTGVTGTVNTTSKTYTISGTPTTAGTYNYTVTTTQSSGTAVVLTGKITTSTQQPGTLTLTSGSATQTAYVGTAISSIVYTYAGGATGVTVTGLPTGVSATVDSTAKTVTISGTPTATNIGSYSVVTVGGSTNATLTGTITVNATTTLSSPSNITASATNSSISLSWDALSNASSYTVDLCKAGTGTSDVTMYFNAQNTTLSTGDTEGTTLTPSSKSTCYTPTSGSAYRTGSGNDHSLTLVSTDNVSQLVIEGSSSGTLRTLNSYSVNSGTAVTTGITQATAATCGSYTIAGLSLKKGDVISFTFSGNFQVNYFIATVGTSSSSCTETTITTNAYTATGLDASTAYTYQVKANASTTGYASGSYSTAASITTSGTVTDVKNEAISRLKITQTGDAITVSGADVANLNIYNITGAKMASDKGSQSIGIVSLTKGVYVIQVTAKDGSVTSKKFLK